MSQPATAVILSDPDSLGGTLDASLVANVGEALAVWATHLSGLGTLTVQLDVSDALDGAEEAEGGPSVGLVDGMADGRVLVELSSHYELDTGTHVPGYASDITIMVNAAFLPQIYLGEDANVPADEIDGLTLFEHEITHGLGFGGLTSTTGSLGPDETLWDHDLANVDGVEVFTGPNAERVNGGPVAVTTLANGEGYAHLANSAADPNANDLMSGLGLGPGVIRPISSLDLAILADVGTPITGIPGTVSITAAPLAGSAGVALLLGGVSLVDTGALTTSTVTLTVTDPGGVLAYAGSTAGVTATVAADGHGATLSGALAAVQASLAGLTDAPIAGGDTLGPVAGGDTLGPLAGGDTLGLALRDSYGNAGSATLSVTAAPPVVTAVTASADAAGPLRAGHAITLTLLTSAPVLVASGTPVLALSDGGTAGFDQAASGATSLAFTTTVVAGQDAADLTVTGLLLAGATLTDATADPLALALGPTTPGSQTGIVVDTTAPAPPTLALSGGGSLAASAIPGLLGTAEPGSTVTLRDGAVPLGSAVADASGDWSLAPTAELTVGASTLTATATDAAGNVSAATTLAVTLAQPAGTATAGTSVTPAAAPDPVHLVGAASGFAADAGADVVLAAAAAGTASVTGNAAAASAMTLFGQAGTLQYANGGGSALVVADGASALALAGGTAGSSLLAFTGAAATAYAGGAGTDELIGGSGALSVAGGSGGSLLVFGGSGPLVLVGGAEHDTVVGGSGAETIEAAAGGVFAGTGGSVLFAQGSGTFLAGDVGGDRLAAAASGGDILAAGSGAETLDGGASSYANLLFGGSGADLVRLGAGADTFVAGSGGGVVQLGSGSAALFLTGGGGGGAATTILVGGGGADSVTGFRPGTDHLALPSGSAATATPVAGGTLLALADGTRLTLIGLTGPGVAGPGVAGLG